MSLVLEIMLSSVHLIFSMYTNPVLDLYATAQQQSLVLGSVALLFTRTAKMNKHTRNI